MFEADVAALSLEADVDAMHPRLRVAGAAADLPALLAAIAGDAASP